jgi:hypothetical protein
VGSAALPAQAQMGQTGMAPAGGVLNRAAAGFSNLNQYGPGYFYYGLNFADRGLGYNGSYMTLGGFIPYGEDDLGGFWSADLRGHLSEYGGFFSNLGVVRKQFVGGSILGVGVYWDYDGDQNQYPTDGVVGSGRFGEFGHAYNQVGVSAELLTDYGNIRSNGYMPVGTTAYTVGNPGVPFYNNLVMCQYGLDAALSGVDLEVGAYIPGLTDWAGMVSVGGYALGNARYDWTAGRRDGDDVVPWFGGVYTRLDLTLRENWDFSLQANNDSFFDWTGFARLTYRMGGSRRRSVPDQMEQPMMRNEHIVRAHQTPIVATNGDNGGLPWHVIHVDNSAPDGGDGSYERPFNTLAEGDAAATRAWDIVFVNRGTGTAVGYDTEFSFNAANQFLVGNGASFLIDTRSCGLVDIATDTSGERPLLSNPTGNSIAIDGAVAPGAVVSNFNIVGSQTGIYATGDLSSGISRSGPATPITYASPTGDTVIMDVAITGNGGPGQRGVQLNGDPARVAGATTLQGGITFFDTAIANTTAGGLVITEDPSSVAADPPRITYNGSIAGGPQGTFNPVVYIDGTTSGSIDIAVGSAPAGSTVPNRVVDVGGDGIHILNTDGGDITIGNATLNNNAETAIFVFNSDADVEVFGSLPGTTLPGTTAGIVKDTDGAAIRVDGAGAGQGDFTYVGTITNEQGPGAGPSYLLDVANTAGGAVTLVSPAGSPFTDSGDGIIISNAAGDVNVLGAEISSSGAQGILITGSTGTYSFGDVTIDDADNAGVSIINSAGSLAQFTNLNLSLGGSALGLQGLNTGNINVFGSTIDTDNTAISLAQTESVNMNFATVSVGGTAPAGDAIILSGGPPMAGTLTIQSAFTVNGNKGTVAADVNNTSPVVVTVPP